MENQDLLDHMDQEVLRDHLEIWVFLVNKDHMVVMEPVGKKVNLEMGSRMLCSVMPVQEVSFLRLPKVQVCLALLDPQVFQALTEVRENVEMFRSMIPKIMRIWSRVHLDL